MNGRALPRTAQDAVNCNQNCCRTPAERLEPDLVLGRHSAEETAEVDAILSRQTTSDLYRRSA
jgi:hypothetical protein